MRYAVVDIGTNSARLMIAHVEDGRIVADYKTLRLIRVGEGMVDRRVIVPAAMERTRQALREFLAISREYGAAERFMCFATSAVRDAENRDEFTDYIRRECGVDIDIISGDNEAILGFAGSVGGFGGMFDIGGGSTEVMTGTLHKPLFRHSFNVGTVRLLQMFPSADEADPRAFECARAHIRSTFSGIPAPEGFTYTGIGGTATALAALDLELTEYDAERVHGYVLSLETVKRLEAMLMSKTKRQREQIAGLPEKKADVIVFGAMLCREFMELAGADRIVVSDCDNLEGYLSLKLNLVPDAAATPSGIQ
ncbi:MAG: Ppx/GppA family phosphatase [Christensenellaceae bacterium]|nr:Ppx/GppA family phosphatase [Christensenellaceae bacterium]